MTFESSHASVFDIKEEVLAAQTAAINRAIASRDKAFDIMDQMAQLMPNIIPPNPVPEAPTLEARIDANLIIPPIETSNLGVITPINRPDSVLESTVDIPSINIQPLNVNFDVLRMPEAPTSRADIAPPEKIDFFGEVQIPDAFVPGADPNIPVLTSIELPTYTAPAFPEFNAVSPDFQASPVSLVMQWAEQEYVPEVIEAALEKLRSMWAGNSGIPPDVERAMWERAVSREDIQIQRDVSAAMNEFSSRGFTLPSGVLAARIDAIRDAGQVKKNALGRDITIKLTEAQLENMKFACTTALAAESTLINIWDNEAKRRFESAKFSIESQISFFNAQVNLYNARQSAYSVEANVYKAKIDAELAKLNAYKAQIEGESLKGQINAQKVQIYAEQYKAIATKAETYKATMQGAAVQAEVIRGKIDAYKAQIEAYATELNAEKTKFDLYDAQVKGELGKAQLLETQVKAYTAYISGEGIKVDLAAKNNEARIAKNEMLIKQYVTNIEKDKALIQAQSAAISANAEAHKVNMARFTAQAGVEQEGVKLKIQASESAMARSLQLYEIEIKKYQADLEQMLRVSSAQLESMKSAGQIASTLAAGAMAGISISSGISGSSGINYSDSRSTATSKSESVSKSFEAVSKSDLY